MNQGLKYSYWCIVKYLTRLHHYILFGYNFLHSLLIIRVHVHIFYGLFKGIYANIVYYLSLNESWSDILSNITSGNYTLSSVEQDSFKSENSSCSSCQLIHSLMCGSVDIESSASVYETAVSFYETSGSFNEVSDSLCDTSDSKTESFGLTSSSSFLNHAFCLPEDEVGLIEAATSSNELVLKDILKKL